MNIRVTAAALLATGLLGIVLFHRPFGFQARLALAQSTQAVPLDAMRHNNLGVALMDAGPQDPQYFPEAIKEFQAALELAPTYRLAKTNLGMAYYYSGQKEKSLALLNELLEMFPEDLHVIFLLGLLHETDGNYGPAKEYFQKVTQLDPNDAKAWYNLGFCFSKMRRYDEAISPLRKAAVLEPYQRQFRYNLFMALNRAGRSQEARVELENFKRLESFSIKAVAPPKSTLEYLRQGKYAEAIADSGPLSPANPPAPNYTNVAQQLGVRLPSPIPDNDAMLQRALKGSPAARGWFADQVNQKKLVAAASAGSAFCDYNRDGRLDIFLVNPGGKHVLLEQKPDGPYEDVTDRVGLGKKLAIGTGCVWGDIDNDGWADLLLTGYGEVRLLRNNRGKFEDITEAAAIAKRIPANAWFLGPAMADVDHDGDLDIFLPGFVDLNQLPDKAELRFPGDFGGLPNLLFRNNLDGTFEEIGKEAKVSGTGKPARAVYFSDVNNDRAVDGVIWEASGKAVVYLNQNDGSFVWSDLQTKSLPLFPPIGESRSYGDFNRDGAIDELIVGAGQPVILHRNENKPAHWLIVHLQGYAEPGKMKSNKLGIGTKVEIRSVGRWETKELRAGNGSAGCDAPEVYFDLGSEKRIDFVRSVFPSGVRWTLKDVGANQEIKVLEPLLDVNSCPTLFAWNGQSYGFISDTISAGILGELVTPGIYSKPDPDEWVRIAGDQLKPSRHGTFDFRWANPLEEVTYLDSVRLLAVDHPARVEVYTNERMVNEPKNLFPIELYALDRLQPVAQAMDHHGHEVTFLLRQIDRKYFDDFELLPYKGFAKDWSLTLNLGDLSSNRSPVLLLYSWSYWNSSASIVGAFQAHQQLWGPILEVKGSHGQWRMGTDDLGVSAGLPRMIVLDLSKILRKGENQIRIRSNRTLYYDQILVAERILSYDITQSANEAMLHSSRLPLVAGKLQWLGYPKRVLPDGQLPEIYDYDHVDTQADWGLHAGMLTRYGDVRPLIQKTDDQFVVMEHGEEVTLSFDARSLPAVREGWKRTYFFYSNGYEKGHEIHSATAMTVGPMPFHRMEIYPYQSKPPVFDDQGFWDYQLEWNTRPSFRRH